MKCAVSANVLEVEMNELIIWAGAAILVVGLPILLARNSRKV